MAEVRLERITKIFGKDIIAAKDINLVMSHGELLLFWEACLLPCAINTLVMPIG